MIDCRSSFVSAAVFSGVLAGSAQLTAQAPPARAAPVDAAAARGASAKAPAKVVPVRFAAKDWPSWRGPRYDGSSPCEDLPEKFSSTTNVRWATDLPGPSAGTPIVVGDRVFLSSVDTERQRLVALCLRRQDGKVLWQKTAGSGYRAGGRGSRTALGRRSSYASPSPATDGKRVVFFFGNGDLVAYDYAGEELWRRNIQQDYGDFSFQWTFSATPTMWADRLFLPVLQRDIKTHGLGGPPHTAEPAAAEQVAPIESFLLAFDPRSGATIYRHVRPSVARMESLESYTTMIPHVTKAGRQELLLAGGDVLTGHDPATGRELWRWGTWNEGHIQKWWRLVPSAVIGAGVVLVCAPKRAPVYAIDLADAEGVLDADALVWRSGGRPNKVSSDVPTPAFDGSHFYVLSDVRNALSKVDPKQGKVLWTTDLPRIKWRASPTVADGRIYIISHHGDVVVFEADGGQIVHRTRLGNEDDDQIRSSIVVAHDCLFVRTNDRLYCFAKSSRK